MIEYAQALDEILSRCKALPEETIPLAQSMGRIAASDIASPANLPAFNNSAMDGFALNGAGKTIAANSEFDVHGVQAAGDERIAASKGAIEIMTGARVPDGMDTVIPIEQVAILSRDDQGQATRIRVNEDVPHWQNIRSAGQDIAQGEIFINRGNQIQSQHIMMLAALGFAEINVIRKARVAVLCTGRELVDDAKATLQSGEIRNSNGPYIAAQLQAYGADVVLQQTIPDNADAFSTALKQAVDLHCDIIISTGAVSMGQFDFVPQTLEAFGAQTIFHKVKMRPGKPLLFAQLPNKALMFGLPGNPVSSAVGLRFFVYPALRALSDLPAEVSIKAQLEKPFHKKSGFRFFQKSTLAFSPKGELQVSILGGQESFKILPLLQANAWAVFSEDDADFAAGAQIEVYGMHCDEFQLSRQN